MDGVLVVNKPGGCTSHDVVARARRVLNTRRVGHAGTLDPLARGVLVLLVGQATRLAQFVAGHDKEYRARLLLGVETDTQDVEGSTLSETSAAHLTEDAIHEALAGFRGPISQVPPMYSAIKVDGERLYRLARAGKTVDRAAREVTVYELSLESFQPGERAVAEIACRVSAGCYIRTLCAEIGQTLGVGGCMASLVRASVGGFRIEDAISLEEAQDWDAARLEACLLPVEAAVQDVWRIDVDEEAERRFCHGMPVAVSGTAPETVRVHGAGGRLLGIGKMCSDSAEMHPVKVLHGQ